MTKYVERRHRQVLVASRKAKRKKSSHWKQAVTEPRPVSALNKSSWIPAKQSADKWFQLKSKETIRRLCQFFDIRSNQREKREEEYLRSSVTVKHSRRFNSLFTRLLVATFTFEQVVSLTRSINVTEQFPHVFSSEMSTDISLFIYDTRREVLFVGLTLEN